MKEYLTSSQVTSLQQGFPPRADAERYSRNAKESIRRLHAAGVSILAGTDAGNPGTAHGVSIHEELALLVEAGLEPTDALAAATSRPARRFGLVNRGRIARGARADLVLVDGNPTHDITASRAIVRIWKNGTAVDRSAALPKSQAAPATALISGFDGDKIEVMLFTGDNPQPLIKTFGAESAWAERRFELSSFAGADLAHVRAIAVCASDPAGEYRMTIDQFEVR